MHVIIHRVLRQSKSNNCLKVGVEGVFCADLGVQLDQRTCMRAPRGAAARTSAARRPARPAPASARSGREFCEPRFDCFFAQGLVGNFASLDLILFAQLLRKSCGYFNISAEVLSAFAQSK